MGIVWPCSSYQPVLYHLPLPLTPWRCVPYNNPMNTPTNPLMNARPVYPEQRSQQERPSPLRAALLRHFENFQGVTAPVGATPRLRQEGTL